MERDPQKETEIQGSMPNVQVPAIKFIQCKKLLYVQMNIRSIVVMPSGKLRSYQGFLFKVDLKGITLPTLPVRVNSESLLSFVFDWEMSSNCLPKIRLVGEFPTLFHPHFRYGFRIEKFGFTSGEWVDYKREDDRDLEKDLGSYILRVARSLKYEEGYINQNADRIGNREALDYYLHERQSGKFPTDNVQLPSGKTFKITSGADNEVQGSHPTSIPQHQPPKFQPLAVQQQPQRKVKFEVRESQPPYSPISSPIEKIRRDERLIPQLNSDVRENEWFSTNHEFYVTIAAFNTISQHIGWGKPTNENVVEQGGILLGSAFRDPKTEITYAITSQAIPGKLAKGTSSYLEVTHETWKEMLDDVDRLNTGLQVIGWYHTHPNNLDVFMSGTDCATQSRLFGNDWQFAIVLNPHKSIWRAFYGSNSSECRGYVLSMNPPLPATHEH